MPEPVWVLIDSVKAIHKRQLAEHGGASGIRDIGLLESALAKPLNTYLYSKGQTSAAELAASYAFGIARNHLFVDGNKRTAFVVSLLFLKLNGWGINTTANNLYETFMNLAEGSLSEDALAKWFISVVELSVSKDG